MKVVTYGSLRVLAVDLQVYLITPDRTFCLRLYPPYVQSKPAWRIHVWAEDVQL